MEAVQVMMREHDRIGAVLQAFDRFATALPDDEAAARAELARFVDFLREYADGRHHGKEEHVLFLAMVRHGFSVDDGPLGMMLFEHQDLRELLGRLRDLGQQEAPWSDADRRQVLDTVLTYSGTLREHIVKENEMLYPMAIEMLPADVQRAVDLECASLDRGRADAGARLEALADVLAAGGSGAAAAGEAG